ncbi:MAG TPA: division/cell wall cluster transcriptional repressor MraZ [Gammaproteobacteria bacterium]|nr:division/cell wall cluster transcriptional repressor MraZ [Gammaproteobacteria bacterium]
MEVAGVAISFRGVNVVTLDVKGRLAVPAVHRQKLADHCDGQVVVTLNRETSLLLYPLPEWEEVARRILRLPESEYASSLRAVMVANATDCRLDGHGRVLLPALHRELTSITKTARVIGIGGRLEIWDEATWDEKLRRSLDVVREEPPPSVGEILIN